MSQLDGSSLVATKTGLRWEKSCIFSSLKTLVVGSAQVLWQSSLTGANQQSQEMP